MTTEGTDSRTHEAILQLLNRQVGDTYFPADSFAEAEAWNSIPIVYAQEHPDLDAFEKDPEKELARIAEKTGKRAEIVGHIANARLETTGHPKLMSDLVLNHDPEVFQLVEAGKLSHSTGFWAKPSDGSLKGPVVPNHLLVFEENESNQPRDRGAVILNKAEAGDLVAFTNEGRVMSGKNLTKFQSIMQSLQEFFSEITGGEQVEIKVEEEKPQEEETPVTNMTDEIVASKDAEITALKEQNVALLNKIAEQEKAQKDASWAALKNKLPPGWVHTAEKEAETRNLFETEPVAFANKLLEVRTAPSNPVEGQQFVNKDDANDPLAIGRELRMATGRIR